jgi:glycosyltransferase involved in cell wall biosynthesis
MTYQKDKIDIIIPTYNHGKFILDAIKSVEAQTLKSNKIIVINDGSPDDTEEIIKNYKSTIPVLYFRNQHLGPNAARNVGLKNSDSEFIALLDADDMWFPEKLEEQMNVFKTTQFKNLGVVYCRYNIIDESGEINYGASVVEPDPEMRGDIYERLLKANRITSSASGVLIKREFIDTVGEFDETLRIGEDWDMWLRLSKVCGYDYVDKVLVKIRRHSSNFQGKLLYVFEHEMNLYNKFALNIEANNPILKTWGYYLVDKIIGSLPKKDFIKIANVQLTSEAKKRLFRPGLGSLKIYLLRIIITRFIKYSFAHLKNFVYDLVKTIQYFISVLF